MIAPVDRAISLFEPAATVDPELCERHYRQVHTPWARRMLRGVASVESYHTARAVSRFDCGAFGHPPTRWRYVLLRHAPDAKPRFTAEAEAHIAEDHRNFLQDWRGFTASTTTVVDRRSGQSTFVAYLLELWRDAGRDGESDRALDDTIATLVATADDAFGLRAITVNRVVTESTAEPIDLQGQRPNRSPLPETRASAFVEILFDHEDWALDWFRSPPVASVVAPGAGARLSATLHRVELACGFDRG